MFNKSKYASSTNTLYKVKARFLFLSGLFLLILTGCQICVNSAFSPEYNVKPLNEHHDIFPMPVNKLLICCMSTFTAPERNMKECRECIHLNV